MNGRDRRVTRLLNVLGNSAELPLAGSIVDNIKGMVGSGYTELSSTLPYTIPSNVNSPSAIVSISGSLNAQTTIVSATKNLFNIDGLVPIVSNVTKTAYLTGFKMTGTPTASWATKNVSFIINGLKPSTVYRLKTELVSNDGRSKTIIIYEAGNTSNILSNVLNTSHNYTFTTPPSGNIDIRFYLTDSGATANPIETSFYDIIISEGTAVNAYAQYFNESYTIDPFGNGFSQSVRIVPGSTISNTGGVINSVSSVQIPVSDSVKKINGSSPDTNGNIMTGMIAGKSYVYFGDSIFEFGTFPEQIGAITGSTSYNVGFGGCRWADHADSNYTKFSMWALADAIFNNNFTAQDAANTALIAQGDDNSVNLNRLKAINWSTIDGIVIGYGTNDFGGNVALGTNTDMITSTFYGAINYAIQKLISKYPKIKIYLLTPIYRNAIPTGGTNSDTTANTNGKFLKDYANVLIEMGQKYHLPVLNLYDQSGINSYNQATWLVDGTHPTADGYTLMANRIAKFLCSI